MNQTTVRVSADALTRFVRQLLVRMDVPPHHAKIVADVLVWANLRGVDSHGVLRLPRYLNLIDQKLMNPAAEITVKHETPATLLIDANRALGPVALSFAMERAIDKARAVGIGWGLVGRMTHAAAVGYYALMAAREDMVGLVITTSLPNMIYHGARAPGVATSPIAIAAPGLHHAPVMLDMATAVVAFGKLAQARNMGQPIPEGWALTRDGEPTTDSETAAIPMPLGGPKGSGLSLMFECLTGLMAGNPLISPELTAPPGGRRHSQNGLAVAINISAFIDPNEYKGGVDRMIAALKTLPKAEGTDEILVPGERGDKILIDRRRDGIPLPPGTWKGLEDAAARFGFDMPDTL